MATRITVVMSPVGLSHRPSASRQLGTALPEQRSNHPSHPSHDTPVSYRPGVAAASRQPRCGHSNPGAESKTRITFGALPISPRPASSVREHLGTVRPHTGPTSEMAIASVGSEPFRAVTNIKDQQTSQAPHFNLNLKGSASNLKVGTQPQYPLTAILYHAVQSTGTEPSRQCAALGKGQLMCCGGHSTRSLRAYITLFQARRPTQLGSAQRWVRAS